MSNYVFVGLGNPGQEYEGTRHNTGRILLSIIGKQYDAEWKEDKKLSAQVAKIKVGLPASASRRQAGKSPVTLVLPDTFMNNSGKSIKPLITSVKSAEKLVVVYDDLDMPFGSSKISFNKSSGGHRGLESIIKAIKTEKFARVRVGISPKTPTGKLKKPSGEDAVMKVIMGKFKPEEILVLKKLSKKISEALETFVSSGLERAMTRFN